MPCVRFLKTTLAVLTVLAVMAAVPVAQARQVDDGKALEGGMLAASKGTVAAGLAGDAVTGGAVRCEGGEAAGFPCTDVDLLAYLPVDMLSVRGSALNDLWGWEDPQTGRRYVLAGRVDGVSIVDITEPERPVLVGDLPRRRGTRPAAWRDMKVYADHLFVVADGAASHGMQVLDLKLVREATDLPVTFTETAVYDGVGTVHNIAINEASGMAYLVGSSGGIAPCGAGLHVVDVRDPANPVKAGCFADVRAARQYTHDVQCVTYAGPDARYTGREICFGANESSVGISDMTDPSRPVALGLGSYPDAAYVHQGWLTEDQRFFFQNDELDEIRSAGATRTMIWDVADLEDPVLAAVYQSDLATIDHNLYVHGDRMYQANYEAGLRVMDISVPLRPKLVGWFDTVAGSDGASFEGAWSVYPWFSDGTVAVSSRREGLFLVRLQSPTQAVAVEGPTEGPGGTHALTVYPNPVGDRFRYRIEADEPQQSLRVELFDAAGQRVRFVEVAASYRVVDRALDVNGLAPGSYILRVTGASVSESRVLTLVR